MITNEQVSQLFRFCEKHYVRHYDVQCELVDHLSNAIEERMTSDPQLSFENALDKVYAGFGKMGFAGIVDSRAAALGKQYRRIRWSLFKKFFTLPKIAMTACVLIALWTLPKFLSPPQLTIFVCVFTGMVMAYETYLFVNYYLRARKARKQLLLLQSGAFQSSAAIVLFTHFGMNYLFLDKRDIRQWEYYAVTGIVFLVLLGLVAYQKSLVQLVQRAKKEYPQAFA